MTLRRCRSEKLFIYVNIKSHIHEPDAAKVIKLLILFAHFPFFLIFEAQRHINRPFTTEEQRTGRESERPYCWCSAIADKVKGCYGSLLEPESNLGKPQSQHGRGRIN